MRFSKKNSCAGCLAIKKKSCSLGVPVKILPGEGYVPEDPCYKPVSTYELSVLRGKYAEEKKNG